MTTQKLGSKKEIWLKSLKKLFILGLSSGLILPYLSNIHANAILEQDYKKRFKNEINLKGKHPEFILYQEIKKETELNNKAKDKEYINKIFSDQSINWFEFSELSKKKLINLEKFEKNLKEADKLINIAADEGDLKGLELAINKGADVNYYYDGYSPLNLAAENGDLKIIDILIEKGAYICCKNAYGLMPLDSAVYKGHKEAVELLIEKGAPINYRNMGFTPLHSAIERGHKEIAILLIEKGADIYTKDCRSYGSNPLAMYGLRPKEWARRKGYLDIIALIEKIEEKLNKK